MKNEIKTADNHKSHKPRRRKKGKAALQEEEHSVIRILSCQKEVKGNFLNHIFHSYLLQIREKTFADTKGHRLSTKPGGYTL